MCGNQKEMIATVQRVVIIINNLYRQMMMCVCVCSVREKKKKLKRNKEKREEEKGNKTVKKT